MLKYIIAVSNDSLSPALVVGALLAVYAARAGRGAEKPLWLGFWAGAAAAVALVVLKKNTGFVVREYYNLAALLPAMALQALLSPLIWLPRKSPLAGAAGKAFIVLCSLVVMLWTAYALPYTLFHPFDFGVGMDTVFNTAYAYKVIGYCLGITLAVLALFAVRAIVRQLPPGMAQLAFQAMLLVFTARQAVSALQIALARNMIRRTPALLGVTIDMTNRAVWFMFALMAVCAACAAAVYLKSRFARYEAENPALLRKLKALARNQRRWCAALALVFVAAALSVTVGAAHESRETVLEPPKQISVEDGVIVLPLETIDDGRLHRFKHHHPDGTEIRFIVIKKNETAFGVGLDACDICGASGYYERNGQVVCILCDVVMNKSTIGFPGGCNPVPLRYRVAEGSMRIAVEDLEKDVWRFKE